MAPMGSSKREATLKAVPNISAAVSAGEVLLSTIIFLVPSTVSSTVLVNRGVFD